MTQYVLVHGAWLGGWCWARVARQLRAAGHDVYAPSLTGLGDRSHLLSEANNLSTHIDDICNIITWEGLGDVVLCGHSYGGFVITGVADRLPDKISALVYLDALVPEDGQSMFDNVPKVFADMFEARAADGDGFSVAPNTAEEFGVNADDRAWVDEMSTKQSINCFREPLALTGAYAGIENRTFIWASGFEHPTTVANYECFKDDPSWRVEVIDCGHHVMIDRPDEVVQILTSRV